MGENDSKWNNRQIINFQNIQAADINSIPEKRKKEKKKKKKKSPMKKCAKDLNKHLFPKKTYIINTWRGDQCHSLLEKCKSELQWDITSPQSEWL